MPESIAWSRYPWAKAAVRRRLARFVRRVPSAQAARISARYPASLYRPGTVMLYRHHRPLGCVLLRQGQVSLEFGHGSRAARGILVEGPVLIGQWHAMHRAPFPVTARAMSPAVVAHVPRGDAGMVGGRSAGRTTRRTAAT